MKVIHHEGGKPIVMDAEENVVVPQPDREALAKVALKTYNEWASLSPLKQISFGYPSLGKLIADAVLAALSNSPESPDSSPVEGEVEWRKAFAAELRAAVGAVVKPSAGAAGVFEFSPKGDSMEFWSYGNATAYSGAVIEVLRMLDPDMEFERATTYHGGREQPRTLDEALAESREVQS